MINKVILVGNVGQQPEVRVTNIGLEIANFTLATSESYKDKQGQRKEKTEWHKIVVYNPGLIKLIKNYINKGTKLYIEGQIKTRKWENKKGESQYSTEIVLQNFTGEIKILSPRKESNDNNYEEDIPLF